MGFWGPEFLFFTFLSYVGPACQLAIGKRNPTYSLAETGRSAHTGSPLHTFLPDKLIWDFCFSNLDPVTRMPHCDEMICLEFTVEEVAKKARDLITLKSKDKS